VKLELFCKFEVTLFYNLANPMYILSINIRTDSPFSNFNRKLSNNELEIIPDLGPVSANITLLSL